MIYGMVFMVLSIFRFGSERKGLYLGLSAVCMIGVAIVTLLFARATNFTKYKKDQVQQRGLEIRPFNDEIVVPPEEAPVQSAQPIGTRRQGGTDEIDEVF